ncbi:MAG TPA: metallophosphoesterase [Candidatus Aquilonibacter sp.]|nr:metallophosphoesterase [Candidatus Aquilonibacter sp.]
MAGWCAPTPKRQPPNVNVLMLSDLHFDPFHDPAKALALRHLPISEWPAILDKRDSATRLSSFSELQRACKIRGEDTTWTLLRSSLREARQQEPSPLFITVSGDLLAHGFICRSQKLFSGATSEELSFFAAKTVAFVAQQIHESFPKTPIYFALGNNDSGCGDYRDEPDSAFLKSVAKVFAADIPDAANRESFRATFPHLGDYTVTLPSPIHDTRLIVLQDIFESTHHLDCNGQANNAPAEQQIAWLRKQLTEARDAGEQVWVMAHIPPGVDIYATYHRYLFAPGEACNVKQPQMFLSSEALGDTIADFSDIVRLAIFAHTHMDEIKLIESAKQEGGEDSNAVVPVKLVPSISPINGNEPAFIVAQVAPQTATLKDYEVYSASTAQGTGWGLEYRFSKAYGLPDFSAASVQKLTSNLIDDKTGEDEVSRTYEKYFLTGGGTFAALGLQRLWPEYSCSLRERDPVAFHHCMCPDGKLAKSQTP